MLNKVVLLICDGLGDRPIRDFGGQTPLEAASTPVLDAIAAQAQCGLMYPIRVGVVPGSDVAHLSIFGYDPDLCYCGRGAIEATGIGMSLEAGDVALRGSLGTVDATGTITDRRAGRIRVVAPLTAALDGMQIDGVAFLVKPGTGHRAVVVMRGEGLSDAITDADPRHADVPVALVRPTDDRRESQRTATVLNEFLGRAHETLDAHPLNTERRGEGQLPANYLLLRGAGRYRPVPSFEERYGFRAACVAGAGLYKGVGRYLGMEALDAPGATGLPDSDLRAKVRVAMSNLNVYDFLFVHIKATDSLGEDGDCAGKRRFIEKIDAAVAEFQHLPDDVLFVMTGDHSTPCALREHSADPVPIMFRGSGVRIDSVPRFGERPCATGGLGTINGGDVMPQITNLFGRAPLWASCARRQPVPVLC